MKKTNSEAVSEAVAKVIAFDPLALAKSRTSIAKPIEIPNPNVELFDDPQHDGQYWGN